MKTSTTRIARLFLFALLFGGMVTLSATAQTDDEVKAVLLEQLVEAMDFPSLMTKQFAQMDASSTGLPEEIFALFKERFVAAVNASDMAEQIFLPIIGDHFTVDELALIVAFVETPFGSKLVKMTVNGQKVDVEKMMENGEVTEEEMALMLALNEDLGDKKNILLDPNIHIDLMAAFEAYGNALGTEIGTQLATEMFSEPAE